MPAAVRIPVLQGTEAWLGVRRVKVTATDIPVLLGLSQYKCEADLADEKDGRDVAREIGVAARRGKALEPLMAELYHEATGRKVRRQHGMVQHPEIEWAAASLDAVAAGPRVVEFKTTGNRSRFADGLPDDVRAQVAWQLGCTGWERADVLVMVGDDVLPVFEVDADPVLFADLVTIAEDFRRRLAAGGPFSRDMNRIRRDHPADDGTEIAADSDLDAAARALLDVRAAIKRHEATEEQLVRALTDRMGDASLLTGSGWHATWKRTKDQASTDWRGVAESLLATLTETDRSAVVGPFTSVRPGFRPFRLVADHKEA